MGLTKSQVFSKKQNKLAEYAKALAHPARIAILEYLASNETCICGELVDVLPLSQSTISQHLKELKRIGIIKGEVEGPKVCYCIDPKAWREAREMLGSLLDSMNCC